MFISVILQGTISHDIGTLAGIRGIRIVLVVAQYHTSKSGTRKSPRLAEIIGSESRPKMHAATAFQPVLIGLGLARERAIETSNGMARGDQMGAIDS